MRASTLATLELVTTRPKTRSPGWTLVSLTATSRICGAALGARRSTCLDGPTWASPAGVGTGDALGATVGEADGVGPPLSAPDARRDDPGLAEAAGGFSAAVGCGPVERTGWLQPQTSRPIPTHAARV